MVEREVKTLQLLCASIPHKACAAYDERAGRETFRDFYSQCDLQFRATTSGVWGDYAFKCVLDGLPIITFACGPRVVQRTRRRSHSYLYESLRGRTRRSVSCTTNRQRGMVAGSASLKYSCTCVGTSVGPRVSWTTLCVTPAPAGKDGSGVSLLAACLATVSF